MSSPVRHHRFRRAALASLLGIASVATLATAASAANPDTCLPNCPPIAGSAYGIVTLPGPNWAVTNGYNSEGNANFVSHNAVGEFAISMPGLTAPGGTLHVSGFSFNCNAWSWSASQASGTTALVHCFDGAGNPVDTAFSFNFTSQRKGFYPPYAYAWVDDADSASSTPNLAYQFDQGSTITVQHPHTGSYTVKIPYTGYAGGGAPKVTAVGSNAWCEVVNFNGPTSTEKITVKCATPAGVATNSQFTITFMRETDQLDEHTLAEGYAQFNPPLDTGTFLNSGNYTSWESTGGDPTAYKSQTGLYSVHFPGLATVGNPQITTLGSKANRCRLVNISADQGTTTVQVACSKITSTSKFVDNPFLIQVTTTS